jgi:hypothetical protein
MSRAACSLGRFLPTAASGGTADKPPPGDWKITELTGSIMSKHGVEAPPGWLCTRADTRETAQAVPDSELNFMSLGWKGDVHQAIVKRRRAARSPLSHFRGTAPTTL